MFIYKDFPFGRLVIKHKEAGAVIVVKQDNSVFIGRFFRDQMPETIKYAFRFKNWRTKGA